MKRGRRKQKLDVQMTVAVCAPLEDEFDVEGWYAGWLTLLEWDSDTAVVGAGEQLEAVGKESVEA